MILIIKKWGDRKFQKNESKAQIQTKYKQNTNCQFSRTPLFSARFSKELRILKQKKSIKDQRNFYSNTFFKLFANSVSAHSKI